MMEAARVEPNAITVYIGGYTIILNLYHIGISEITLFNKDTKRVPVVSNNQYI